MTTKPQIALLPKWDGNYRRMPTFLAGLALYAALIIPLIILQLPIFFPESNLSAVFYGLVVLSIVAFTTMHQWALWWGRTYNIGLRHKWTRIGLIASLLIPYLGFLVLLFLVFAPEHTYYPGNEDAS